MKWGIQIIVKCLMRCSDYILEENTGDNNGTNFRKIKEDGKGKKYDCIIELAEELIVHI